MSQWQSTICCIRTTLASASEASLRRCGPIDQHRLRRVEPESHERYRGRLCHVLNRGPVGRTRITASTMTLWPARRTASASSATVE